MLRHGTKTPYSLRERGERIHRTMKLRGYTSLALASDVGVHAATIRCWINGTRDMKLDDLIKLGETLEVSPGWIAWGENAQ